MEIVNTQTLNQTQRTQAAQMLTDELPIGWPTLADAEREVNERWSGAPNTLALAAIDNGELVGWCGLLPFSGGNVFELRPLVVRNDQQKKGVGSALVNEIATAARNFGGLTLLLGVSDEHPGGETSFANVDLFDNLPKRIQEFVPGSHQSAFYLKLGFKIIGVVPNAKGRGKPDFLLAKPL